MYDSNFQQSLRPFRTEVALFAFLFSLVTLHLKLKEKIVKSVRRGVAGTPQKIRPQASNIQKPIYPKCLSAQRWSSPESLLNSLLYSTIVCFTTLVNELCTLKINKKTLSDNQNSGPTNYRKQEESIRRRRFIKTS